MGISMTTHLSAALMLYYLPCVASAQSLPDAAGQIVKGASETAGKVGEAAVNTAARVISHPVVQHSAGAVAQGARQLAQTTVDGLGAVAGDRDVTRAALAGVQVVRAAGAVSEPVRAVGQEIARAAIDQSSIPAAMRPLAKEVIGVVSDKNPAQAAGVAIVEAAARGALSSETNGTGPRSHGQQYGPTNGYTGDGNSTGNGPAGYKIAAMDSAFAAGQAQHAQGQQPRQPGSTYWTPRIAPGGPVRIAAMDSRFVAVQAQQQREASSGTCARSRQ